MADFNDYKWYNEEETKDLSPQPFYTETVKKNKKRKTLKTIGIALCAAIMVSSVATTGYVLVNGSPLKSASVNRVVSVASKDSAYGFEKMSNSDRKAMTTVEIAANVAPSVVGISCKSTGYFFFGQAVGVVSAVNRTIETSDDGTSMSLIQTDAAINPGNSGGALVNAYGEVIGINSMKFSGNNVEGIGFAIPINTAKPIISDLMKEGYVKGRPLIGISIREISPDVAAINDMPSGLYVSYVAEGGAAEKAGIKKGDMITSFDGKIVESVKEINEIRDTHKAGDTITMVVNRNGESKTFKVTLLEDTSSRGSN